MAGDPYAALGVSRTASADEIKKAYRRIAKTDHPDLNPSAAAAARFKAASAAYDLLKDPEQRRRFDAGEIDDQGQERMRPRQGQQAGGPFGGGPFGAGPFGGRSHGFGAEGDLGDIFADLFGQQRGRAGGGFGGFGGFGDEAPMPNRRGEDLRFALEVDFLTAARGGKTQIRLPDGSALEVSIPEGVRDGQQIRLRGKGAPSPGSGPAGDTYLDISVAPHPVFRREGDDIHMVLPVALDEAVLGARVAAPTIAGPVSLTIPKGASSGRKLRLRGRGIKGGDQHVELRIVMPAEIDPELAAFFEEWRRKHAYDPRAGMGA